MKKLHGKSEKQIKFAENVLPIIIENLNDKISKLKNFLNSGVKRAQNPEKRKTVLMIISEVKNFISVLKNTTSASGILDVYNSPDYMYNYICNTIDKTIEMPESFREIEGQYYRDAITKLSN